MDDSRVQNRSDQIEIGPIAHDEPDAIAVLCADIAEAVFPHVSDRGRRRALAFGLSDLSRLVVRKAQEPDAAFEARIAGLEKDSHPPVPLRPIIIEEVMDAINRGVHRPRFGR